jgi:hypothetical protein
VQEREQLALSDAQEGASGAGVHGAARSLKAGLGTFNLQGRPCANARHCGIAAAL